jgi:anti-anti-sigma factor
MEGIQLSVEKTGVKNRISVIKVGGYIDTTTSAELEHTLDSLLKAGSYDIIVDLGNVDYVSSAGWGIFISEIKGIREKGGDLKLVRMIPEVYEVFELLEFHYILKAFDTLEEAIRDIERSRPSAVIEEVAEIDKKLEGELYDTKAESAEIQTSRQVPTGMSLEEKIQTIVSESPEAGTVQIARMLNTSRFGFARIGWFRLRKILKKSNLESKRKRMIYAKHVSGNRK